MSDASLDRYAAFDQLLFDRPAPHVLRVTLNNPDKRNALSRSLDRQITDVWQVVDADPSVRAAIVTGAGSAFCAGGSMDAMPTGRMDSNARFCDGFGSARGLVRALIEMRKPLVSAINGPAVGAGLAIALLADISIAATDAKLFDGHLRLGVVPGDHAALIWPLLCGMAKAKYYLMTNEVLTGAEAERIGLVSLAVERAELPARAVEIATRLAGTAPTALRMTKYVLNHYLRQNQPIFDLSLAMEMTNFGSNENQEAVRAMAAKETPVFEDGAEEFR